MALDFRLPTEEDILYLLANISIEDKRELRAQAVDTEWAIRHSIELADESLAIIANGNCLCILGITSMGVSGTALPWLLGTDEMKNYPRQVLIYSRRIISRWKSYYPYMENWVDARHHRAINWLTHLGAKFEYHEHYGIYGRPFYKFSFGEQK